MFGSTRRPVHLMFHFRTFMVHFGTEMAVPSCLQRVRETARSGGNSVIGFAQIAYTPSAKVARWWTTNTLRVRVRYSCFRCWPDRDRWIQLYTTDAEFENDNVDDNGCGTITRTESYPLERRKTLRRHPTINFSILRIIIFTIIIGMN